VLRNDLNPLQVPSNPAGHPAVDHQRSIITSRRRSNQLHPCRPMRLLLVLILALMGPGIHDERWLERASFTGFVYRANFALMRLLLHRQDYATEDRFLSRLTRWSGFIQFRPHPQLVQHQRGDLAEFWCRVMISIRYKSRPTPQGTRQWIINVPLLLLGVVQTSCIRVVRCV